MSDSVRNHDNDEISVTPFRATLPQTGKETPLLFEAAFLGSKGRYLALGYGENVQAAVADLYRNYRDIRKEDP